MGGFHVLGEISHVETIASGRQVRERRRLHRAYGSGHWRKMKGVATVRLDRGEILTAEIHWYEAHGIGMRELKLKRLLEASR